MILKRKVYDKLINWKNECNGTKALLIEGARRIGKSTIVEEFSKNEYKSYMLIDFSKATDDVKSYFELYIDDLDTLFMLLQTVYKVKLYERNSVIVFDEIQFCPKARQAIKHLVNDHRYDYIETGSLISIKQNVKDILIPSEERQLKMYPLDFEEFLWAMNESELINLIKNCFENKKELPRLLHNKAMLLFEQYILVGGMPLSVVSYIESNLDFGKADIEKRDILNLYRNDIMKIDSSYKNKIMSIYDSIPGLLSQHEKRVIFKDMVDGSYAPQYEDTFFWLADSGMVNECFLCNDPNIGLSINENRGYIKCYLNDSGLLVSHGFSENEISDSELYKEILNGELGLNNGMLFENFVAQELVSKGHKLYFYTHYNLEKHRNDIEIDFIITNRSKTNYKIYPIEVKSGKTYRTVSLDKFVEKYKERIGQAYIIHPKNLIIKANGIICIPPYMTFCI